MNSRNLSRRSLRLRVRVDLRVRTLDIVNRRSTWLEREREGERDSKLGAKSRNGYL